MGIYSMVANCTVLQVYTHIAKTLFDSVEANRSISTPCRVRPRPETREHVNR